MESRDVGLSWHPLCQPDAEFMPPVFHAKDLPRYRLPGKRCACRMVNNSPANICTPHKHRLLQRLKRLELAFGQSVKYLRQPLKLCHETSCTPSHFLLQTLTSPGRRTGIVGIIGLEDQNAPLIICIVTHSLLKCSQYRTILRLVSKLIRPSALLSILFLVVWQCTMQKSHPKWTPDPSRMVFLQNAMQSISTPWTRRLMLHLNQLVLMSESNSQVPTVRPHTAPEPVKK